MDRAALGRVPTLVLAVGAALAWSLHAGSVPKREGPPSLREFFQGLVEHYGTSPLPTPDEFGRVGEQFDAAGPEEISDALPAIFVAVGHKDATVRAFGGSALLAISVRPDRAELLTKYLRPISGLLTSKDERLPGFAVGVMANLWPKPPPEVLPLLLVYLKRSDVDPGTQLGALTYLIGGSAENPEVVAAAMEFWSRRFNQVTRVGAVNALANSRSKDPRIINLVIASLDDPDFEVRWTAFQGLTRMGPVAMRQARRAMEKVEGDFVSLLRRKDGDVNMQVSVLSVLVLCVPGDPQVVSAVQEFFSRPLDPGARTAALNGLRIPNMKDPRLINLVIASLHDPNQDVRSIAPYVLKDMGSQALMRAQPELEKLAQDPNQPTGVKDAAKRALQEIHRTP